MIEQKLDYHRRPRARVSHSNYYIPENPRSREVSTQRTSSRNYICARGHELMREID